MKIDYKTVALLVALGLVVCLVIAFVGAIVLASQGNDLPASVASRLDAILVGLLGLLAKSPTDNEVTVVNKPSEPVPVEAGHIDSQLVGLVAIVLVVAFLLLLALDVVNIT